MRAFLLALSLTISSGVSFAAPPLPPAPSLAQLNERSEFVAKVTALSSAPVADSSLPDLSEYGFIVSETKFRVISILQGASEPQFAMRHYARGTGEQSAPFGKEPHFYRFVPGRSYLIWAKREGDHLRSTLIEPSLASTQGGLLTIDNRKVQGEIQDVVWRETVDLAHSEISDDAREALQILRQMAAGATPDFAPEAVVDATKDLIESPDLMIAIDALSVAQLAPKRAVPELLRAARNEKNPARQFALLTLEGVKTPDAQKAASDNISDADPAVRAAALSLLGDYPGEPTRALWRAGARDKDAMVRLAVAVAISNAHDSEMLPTLFELAHDFAWFNDKSYSTYEIALDAIFQFPPEVMTPWLRKLREDAFQQNTRFSLYYPLALTDLAHKANDITSYLPALLAMVEEAPAITGRPGVTGGGRYANGVLETWDWLFAHLQKQSPASLQSGRHDEIFDALQNTKQWSNQGMTKLAEFYDANGLPARAQTTRLKLETNIKALQAESRLWIEPRITAPPTPAPPLPAHSTHSPNSPRP